MAAARTRLVPALLMTAPGSYAQRLATFCRDVVEPRARTLRYKAGGRRRVTISHTYGAHDIAARYCRVGRDLRVPGFWMHGWIPEYHNVHPALIALHKRAGLERPETGPETVERLDRGTPQFVSRDDQARYLATHGYTRVTAIGLPIVYLPRPTVPRVPGSLLVLPPHGHRSHGPGDRVAEELAAAIAALRPRFSQIVVGLTEDDVVRGEWVGAFRGHGLDVVVTAQQSDPDTLARLVAILCSFEYVTTNGFGSQIAYAAYCGAKVSVYGPFATFTPERMASVHALRLFPDLLDTALDLCSENALRAAYPFLFVEPDRAIVREAWGAQEVGEPSRLPSPDLARAFGWPAARPILATGGWEREPTRGVTPLRG
jgi:hypothetical protein